MKIVGDNKSHALCQKTTPYVFKELSSFKVKTACLESHSSHKFCRFFLEVIAIVVIQPRTPIAKQ